MYFVSQDLSLQSVDGDPGANLSHGLMNRMNIMNTMQHPASFCIAEFGVPYSFAYEPPLQLVQSGKHEKHSGASL